MTTEQRQAAAAARLKAQAQDHGREGSDAALLLLLRLAARPDTGIGMGELLTTTGLDRTVLTNALKGLASRNRIKCFGRGTAAVWMTIGAYQRLQSGLAS